MLSRAVDTWNDWPVWAKWTSGLGAVVLIDASTTAAREPNFFVGLAEHSAAIVLRYGLMALMIGGGIWVGIQVAKRTKTWLGWVAGLAFAVFVGGFATSAASAIPGVGWRIDAMNNSDCYVDWDGRSNQTVCD